MTPKLVTLKGAPADVAAWERCAAQAGMSRHAWALAMLNIAAGISPLPAHALRAAAALVVDSAAD